MLPNFLVIGAARSGTTSLYKYLQQHPEIYVSHVKETNFFAFDGRRFEFIGPTPHLRARASISSPEVYEGLFRDARNEKAIGEASVSYMTAPGAPERIRRAIPAVRLVALLRNPAERAYANYMGMLRDRRDRWNPWEVLGGALAGRGPQWWFQTYIRQGLYHERLTPYYRTFDPGRIRIHLFEEFVRDPAGILRDLFAFLEVEPEFVADTTTIFNPTGMIRNPLLRTAWISSVNLRARLGRRIPERMRLAGVGVIQRDLVRPPLPDDLRAALVARYREDVERLQDLLCRDLTTWLA